MDTLKATITDMNQDEREYWNEVVELLKEPKYEHINKTYHSKDGWANVAYGVTRCHITYQSTWSEILDILNVRLRKSPYK